MSAITPLYCKDCHLDTNLMRKIFFLVSESELYENEYCIIEDYKNEFGEIIRFRGRILFSFCNHCKRPIKAYFIYDEGKNEKTLANNLLNLLIDKKVKKTRYIEKEVYDDYHFEENEEFVVVYDTVFSDRFDLIEYYYRDYDSKQEAIESAKKFIKCIIEGKKEQNFNYIYYIDIINEQEDYELDIKCPICNDEIKINSKEKQRCHRCNGELLKVYDNKPI